MELTTPDEQIGKIDTNGFYGCLAMFSCIFYNFYCAISTTTQARSANAAASLFFEQFMSNNVPFGSFEELLQYIDNILHETRRFDDREVLDRDVTLNETFFKLIKSSGFGWSPTMTECEILYELLQSLTPTDLNRLFYKDQLFTFVENNKVMQAIIYMLCKLDEPYLDPNVCPDSIKDEMAVFYDLLYEYVYYDKQIIDRLEKMYSLERSVSIIQDTDSSFICYDGWYHFILNNTIGIPMKIKSIETDLDKVIDDEIQEGIHYKEVPDYSFIDQEIIMTDRLVNPMIVIPQDGLKFSIVNILAYCTSKMVNDYMAKYALNLNSVLPDNRPCLLSLKNEFTYYRLICQEAKKHYAGKLVLQEGNLIPDDINKALDVKGIDVFKKTTVNPTVQNKLKKILYEDILSSSDIDPVLILKHLAIIEEEIRQSIQNGEKKYYKPVKIKNINSYEQPMRIQGIKASVVYNALHEPDTDTIDLSIMNSIDIMKVDMNIRNIDRIKNTYPQVYERAIELFRTNKVFESGIDAIAIPFGEPVPKWAIPFVRIYEIINDNIGGFPLESLGLHRGSKSGNYSNLIQF